jgi:hypothetical protein
MDCHIAATNTNRGIFFFFSYCLSPPPRGAPIRCTVLRSASSLIHCTCIVLYLTLSKKKFSEDKHKEAEPTVKTEAMTHVVCGLYLLHQRHATPASLHMANPPWHMGFSAFSHAIACSWMPPLMSSGNYWKIMCVPRGALQHARRFWIRRWMRSLAAVSTPPMPGKCRLGVTTHPILRTGG